MEIVRESKGKVIHAFGAPAKAGATKWDILKTRIATILFTALNRIGVPGAVQDIEIKDAVTGQEIQIKTGLFFTRITVNGRDYYFRRLSGKFDGTGTGCC